MPHGTTRNTHPNQLFVRPPEFDHVNVLTPETFHLRVCIPTPPFGTGRFDASGDGRIDLLNFLNFFLTRDRKERRRAARVTRALEAMREDALNKQVDKIKKQTIGQVDRWVNLKQRAAPLDGDTLRLDIVYGRSYV